MVGHKVVEEHYKKHYKKLCNVVLNRLGNNKHIAQEAVQEAYTRALTFIHCCNFEEADSFDRWFSTILNNSVRDSSKEERNRGLSLEEVNEVESFIDKVVLFKRTTEDVVKTEIKLLTNFNHRDILTLYFITGLSCNDIYKITEASSITMVKQVVHRFKVKVVEKYK